MYRICIISALFLLFYSKAEAQSGNRFVIVKSIDNNKPVFGADVYADFRPEGLLYKGKTDSLGIWEIPATGAFKLTIYPAYDSLQEFSAVYSVVDKSIEVKLLTRDKRLDQVTITGNTGPRAISENPYLVRVIHREKIEQLAAQNLGELLLNEVNIQVGQDAVMGSNAIMQGIGGQDIKILINGIPVIGRVNGNVDLSQIVLNNVERIEIIEGPMSVVYGTDALGGVINVITKTPVGKKLNGRFTSFFDMMRTPGNYNLDAAINTRITPKIPLAINFGRYFFAGQDFNTITRSYDWKPKTKYFGDVSAFWKTANSTHRITSAVFSEKLTDRSDAEYSLANVTGFNSYYKTLRWDNSLHSVFTIDKFKRFEWQNAFNYYGRTKNTIKRNLVTGTETAYRPEDQDTSEFSLFNSRGIYNYRDPVHHVSWSAGYDFSRETALGKRIPSELPGINDVAVFGSVEYSPTKEWQFRPSLRVLHNSRFGNPILTGVFGSRLKMAPIIPSLQIKFNLSSHLAFRGSYSKGFRAPSLKELNFYFVDVNHNIHGNDSLKAETSDNFILSFDYRHQLTKTMGTLFSFSLFNNVIINKINLALIDSRTNYYTYINIGRFRSQGLNTNFEFFTSRSTFQFSAMFLTVYDLLLLSDTVDQKSYINGQIGMNYTYKIPSQRMSVSFLSRYTSPTVGYMENLDRYKTDGFYLLDITAQKSFKNSPWQASAGVKNLLGITTVNSTRRDLSNPHSQQGMNVNITPGRSFFLRFIYNIR